MIGPDDKFIEQELDCMDDMTEGQVAEYIAFLEGNAPSDY